MISISEEILDDRKLFRKLYKENISTMPNAEPHLKGSGLSLNERSVMDKLSNIIRSIEEKIVQPWIRNFQSELVNVEHKINRVNQNVHRIQGYIKMKKKAQVRQKMESNLEKTKYQTPMREQRYKQKYNTPATTIEKSNLSPTQNKPEEFYLSKQFSKLKQEIVHLRNHVASNHPQTKQFSSLAASSTDFPLRLVNFHIPCISDSSYMHQSSENLNRQSVLIKQYEKEQQRYEKKIKKYKATLRYVLSWLKDLKEEELKKMLPCQACEMKNILKDYLTADHTSNHFEESEVNLFSNKEQNFRQKSYQGSSRGQIFSEKPNFKTRQRKISTFSSPAQSAIKNSTQSMKYYPNSVNQIQDFRFDQLQYHRRKLYEEQSQKQIEEILYGNREKREYPHRNEQHEEQNLLREN